MIMIIIIMNKSQELTFFTGAKNWLPLWIKGQESDGRLHQKFVLVGDTVRANPT